MKRKWEEVLLLVMGILFLVVPTVLIFGGIYCLHRWITLPVEQKWVDFNVVGVAGALGAIGLSGSWVFLFSRHLYRKRAIVKIPEKVPREEFNENVMRFTLTDPPLNQLRLEVLRHTIDRVFPGWNIYLRQEKNREKWFDVIEEEFEYADFPPDTKDPSPGVPLSLVEKFIYSSHTRKLFQNGVIVGWRKTFWDTLFFLGPQYLVAFPSGFIIATHIDGLRQTKST
mgnify:CR=1 FL=1